LKYEGSSDAIMIESIYFEQRAPLNFMPSSVKVPVLSKQTTFTLPPSMTFGGEIQIIFSVSNLLIVKLVPIVNAAVIYGGQLRTIKSRNAITISAGFLNFDNMGMKKL